MSIVGTKVVRVEDEKLLTTGGTYIDDLREDALTGAVHAMFVKSDRTRDHHLDRHLGGVVRPRCRRGLHSR